MSGYGGGEALGGLGHSRWNEGDGYGEKERKHCGEVLGTIYGLGFRDHVIRAAMLEDGKVERLFVLIEQIVPFFSAS